MNIRIYCSITCVYLVVLLTSNCILYHLLYFYKKILHLGEVELSLLFYNTKIYQVGAPLMLTASMSHASHFKLKIFVNK